MGALRRLGQQPVGRSFNGVVLVLAFVTLVAFSPPGGYFIVILLGFWVWLAVVLVWVGRFVGVVLVHRCRSWRPWVVAPAIVAATLGAIMVDGPFLVRFHVSEPAMTRFAKGAVGDPTPLRPTFVGLYQVGQVEPLPGGVQFTVGGGFFNDDGFAYSPDHRPPDRGDDSYEHLSGPWYLWYQDF